MMTFHEVDGVLTSSDPDGWLIAGDLRGLMKGLGAITLSDDFHGILSNVHIVTWIIFIMIT